MPGKLAYLPALEDVLIWDLKTGTKLNDFHETGLSALVTFLSPNPVNLSQWAVGYNDGSIRIWSYFNDQPTNLITFNGHRSSVTSLSWDSNGLKLISGSTDTNIIVWDVLAEQGICRLKGHKNSVSSLHFIENDSNQYILSSSFDSFIKLWDLNTQHCIQTLVGHRCEVNSTTISSDQSILASGSNDGDIKLWEINNDQLSLGLKSDDDGNIQKFINLLSTLPTHTINRKRITQLCFHPSENYLAILGTDKSLEILRLRTVDEIKTKMARRKRRNKEKTKNIDVNDTNDQQVSMNDRLTPYMVIHAPGKIKSFSLPTLPPTYDVKAPSQVMLALQSNSVEVHAIPQPTKKSEGEPEPIKLSSLDIPGHRTDIRALALSSDDQLLASASNGQLKIWNMNTLSCLRTIDCGYAICIEFVPGNRQVIVGTKSGNLQLFDLVSSTLIKEVAAHDGCIYDIDISPSKTSFATAGGDSQVKFWDIEQIEKDSDTVENAKMKTSDIVNKRTLKMNDEILSVKFSPDNKYIAVSLLDSTVKIFFTDSLKFYLSLYGHKLPVLSLDISHDSKLIITSSADKNVKIWGLDFGDCHKSIFAHDGSVMQVKFEKSTHNFFSTGKDGLVCYWDGDKFENIQKLKGHQGEIWALATSNNGNFLVSGSHDKSIRIWEKLDDPLFLEEEREKELEELYENDFNENYEREHNNEDNEGVEAGDVLKQTSGTLMAGEKIIEGIELADEDLRAIEDYEDLNDIDKAKVGGPPARNAIFTAFGNPTAQEYVLKYVIEKISPAELHDALLVLPFSHVISLLKYLEYWANKVSCFAFTKRIKISHQLSLTLTGMEYWINSTYTFLFTENTSSSNCGK